MASVVSTARAVAGRPFRPGRVLSQEVIAGLFLAVVANEGARLVAGQAVARPSDVDVAAVLGAGFPRWQGGPMQAADEAGLLRLRTLLRRFADDLRMAALAPEPLWDELIREGRRFGDLNGG
jgi:3-hydroxyacyl-CoA dehydrogenase